MRKASTYLLDMSAAALHNLWEQKKASFCQAKQRLHLEKRKGRYSSK